MAPACQAAAADTLAARRPRPGQQARAGRAVRHRRGARHRHHGGRARRSGSSRAQLVAQIDAPGTNLAHGGSGTVVRRPDCHAAAFGTGHGRADRPGHRAAAIGDVNAQVYRNDRISAANTNAITVYSADVGLLRSAVQGQLGPGQVLDAATARYPAGGARRDAGGALGVDRSGVLVWLGHRWFGVIGIMRPLPLAPELDRTALIGYPVAQRLHATAAPVQICVAQANPARYRRGGRRPA